MQKKGSLDLSVIMPCRNEQNTVGICVDEAMAFMKNYNICGEVLVVDNASTDDSVAVAIKHGASVVTEQEIGYGRAIQTGIASSRGNVLIISDCDATYDFLHLKEIYQLLVENQCDMVIGNRYAGGMERGSMPWSHQWGVRALSFFGRIRFHTDVYDFHCGLRGIRQEAVQKLFFHTTGMEFATEMIAEAVEKNLRIMQIPVILKKCKYERKSKLRTIRDGFRHLIYICGYPREEQKYEK